LKVVVYNKTVAEVFLKPNALKAKEHQKLQRYFDRPNRGPQYTLRWNDQLFQTKLETAVAEGKLKILIFSKKNVSDI
jgi:cell division protease FtsH